MPRRPSSREIALEDERQLKRQQDFRAAADAVAAALTAFPEVEKIALFGSAARPLLREVPRFQPYRRFGIELLHECQDVDLAVWLSRTDRLHDLGRARSQAVSRLHARTGSGVAHHQLDVFLLACEDGRYLGRLCCFAICPKQKPECLVPGCGATPFLRQHEGFRLFSDALAGGNACVLFDRHAGIRALAAELEPQPAAGTA
jgi:hypothetical protein